MMTVGSVPKICPCLKTIFFNMIILNCKPSSQQKIESILSDLKNQNSTYYTFYNFKSEQLNSSNSQFSFYLFAFGFLTFLLAILFQYCIAVLHYPQDLGGKPDFHWNIALPFAFEVSMLVIGILSFIRFLLVLKYKNSLIPKEIIELLQFIPNFYVLIVIDSNDFAKFKRYVEKNFENPSEIEIQEIK